MRRIEARQDDDEFVAAQARDGVGFAHRRGEPLRDRLQQLVAGIVTQRVVDALEMIEIEEQARDVRAVALRLREDLLQPLVQERAVRQSGQDVVLRELVRMRGGDLELLRPLDDLVLERALVRADLRLRLGEPLRHVIERVREEAELVGRSRRHEHVELAGAHRASGAHQPVHRRDEPAREQERRADRDRDQHRGHRQRADHVLAELLLHPVERQADPDVADGRRGGGGGGDALHFGLGFAETHGDRRPGAPDGRDQLDVALAAKGHVRRHHRAGHREPRVGGERGGPAVPSASAMRRAATGSRFASRTTA